VKDGAVDPDGTRPSGLTHPTGSYAGRRLLRGLRRQVTVGAGIDGLMDASGAFISFSAFSDAVRRILSNRRRTSVTLLGVKFDLPRRVITGGLLT
jgi:hypothetical protein